MATIETPFMTATVWDTIKDCSLCEAGGFLIDGGERAVYLTVDGDTWSMEFEDPPQPDPINDDYYLMLDEGEWERVVGGELITSINCIRSDGRDFQLQSVTTEEEKLVQVVGR